MLTPIHLGPWECKGNHYEKDRITSIAPSIWGKVHILDCGVAITQNFYRSGCVFSVAWSPYNTLGLDKEVTKQAMTTTNHWSFLAKCMSLSGQAQAEPAPPIVPSSRSTMVLGLGGQFLTSIGLLKVIPPIDRLLL